MNKDDKARYAAGETDESPTAPVMNEVSGSDAAGHDTAYSPASESETAEKQRDPFPATLDDDIDLRDVRVVPGTGGPDDGGDVDVSSDDLNLPRRD